MSESAIFEKKRLDDDGNGSGISRTSQVMMRLAQHCKKNCLLTLQHGPLSARRELGRLTQADGPEGPTTPVVTTGSREKLDYISRFAHIILAPVHAILLCIVPMKKTSNCDSTKQQSSSRPQWVQPRLFLRSFKKKRPNCACHLCYASALHRGHAKYFKSLTCHQNRGHATHSMYVSSLHKGPCKILCAKKERANDSM